MSFIIPYFIQHQGCPHRCLFCDQTAIAGKKTMDEAGAEVQLSETINLWLSRNTRNRPVQVAFYGGSFTCLPESYQNRLLTVVQSYIQTGSVASARLSTRPDCIDETVCRNLRDHGVKTVEIGVQSMTDHVLTKAKRGHTAETSRRAAQVLLEHGFELGIQLMPGLPGETTTSFLRGVREIIDIAPAFVRLYPAVVIKKSGLARMYNDGWQPLSMNRAITCTRRARELFLGNSIRVIRMGLQPSEALEEQVLAGPYHPAFGSLVISRDWYLKTRKILASIDRGRAKELCVTISDKDYSAFVGQSKQNISRLNELFNDIRLVIVVDRTLERFKIKYVVK